MNIQELVTSETGFLEKEATDILSLPTMLHKHYEASEVLAAGRASLPRSRDNVRRAAAKLATQFSALDQGDSGSEIFAALLQYLEDPSYKEGLQKTIDLVCNRLELAMILSYDRIAFLEYMWQDDLLQKLSDFTGASTEAAQSWIRGDTPALYNQELLLGATTILFQLHRQCGMTREEAVCYFEDVRFANSKDLRLKHHSLWGWISEYVACRISWNGKLIPFPDDIQDHIAELGGDRAVFDRDFRYRFLLS